MPPLVRIRHRLCYVVLVFNIYSADVSLSYPPGDATHNTKQRKQNKTNISGLLHENLSLAVMEIVSGNSADQMKKHRLSKKKAIWILSAILAKRGNLTTILINLAKFKRFWCLILVSVALWNLIQYKKIIIMTLRLFGTPIHHFCRPLPTCSRRNAGPTRVRSAYPYYSKKYEIQQLRCGPRLRLVFHTQILTLLWVFGAYVREKAHLMIWASNRQARQTPPSR